MPLPCVLLVDDDPTTNYLNKSLLQRLQVAEHILVASDGAEALAQLEAHCVPATPTCPALILLDINMPGLNGVQFLEAYQHLPLPATPAPVIVMLSTSLHPRDVARVKALNLVADFITKPLTAGKLDALLTTHFHQTAHEVRPPDAPMG